LKRTSINSNTEINKEKEMADFRRWIFALAVVALLAGLSVPASAQPVVCNTSVSVTPIVRAEGLAELVGDLVLYCTGGTPTTPGKPVPQVNITVFLNTNITSKVLGTQLVAFGNGQTSALDEALLIIDEPNSPNSPGVLCSISGNGENCYSGALTQNGNPYRVLNCGATASGTPVAPDGGPSGPGVCEIIAPTSPTTLSGIAPEHTYDGVFAGSAGYTGESSIYNVADACYAQTTTVTAFSTGTITVGSELVTITGGTNPTPAANWKGASITDTAGDVVAGTTITAVSGSTITLSNAAVGTNSATDAFTITGIPFTSVTPVGGSIGSVGAPGYACGRPNVYQGRIGALQNANQYNAVTFLGVPLDPPGTGIGRTLRITNIRANANQLGVSTTFTTQQILMNVAINGPTTVTLANPQQIVGYVNKGLNPVPSITQGSASFSTTTGAVSLNSAGTRTGVGEFVQCIQENQDLFNATPAPNFSVPGYLGSNPVTGATANLPGGYDCPAGGDCTPSVNGNDSTPWVHFSEGFASSWKTKNISFTVGDGLASPSNANANYNGNNTAGGGCPDAYCYNGGLNHPVDIPQNVPGAVYNTEGGFSFGPQTTSYGPPPNPNPPVGFQFNSNLANSTVPNQGNPFSDDNGAANATGIAKAGIASQGTRLYLSFSNIPAGSSLYTAPVIYLFRQGVQHNNDPATLNANPITGQSQAPTTGVMVMVQNDGVSGADLPTGFGKAASPTTPFALQKVGTSGLVVYEILYTDPYSVEYADVPVVLAYASNPGQNLPAPAPPNPITQVTAGFAPFYTSAASTQPSPNATYQVPTLPVPRFVPGAAFNLLSVQKCACNLLFPFVANVAGYDTGIAIANASLDPGSTFGFSGVPQPGTVEFWYYGTMANGSAVPGPQTSSVVQPGTVLTYVLSTGGTGLDGRGAGFEGYMITQAQFQYCHAFAFVSAQGAGPSTPGVSEGYLGIVLDAPGLYRTNSIGENLGH
jgi:hypothetical protein